MTLLPGRVPDTRTSSDETTTLNRGGTLAMALTFAVLSIAEPALGADSGQTPLATFRLTEEAPELHHAVAFRTTELTSRPGDEITVVVLT